MLNLLVGRRMSRLDWPGSRAERSAWMESPRSRGYACIAADFWIRRERRPRLRGNAKVCVVLDLRGLRALAPAIVLVGLLSRLRYLKAFGARGNFAAPNLERAQVFLNWAAMTVSPTGSSVQLRIAAIEEVSQEWHLQIAAVLIQFAMNRGQNCGYLQSRLWCPSP